MKSNASKTLLSVLILTISTTIFAACSGPQIVASACPEYQPGGVEVQSWFRRALVREDSQAVREWLADLKVLRERLEICRESE